MNRPTPFRTDMFQALMAWIEARLDEPLTLDRIAAQAGLSPHHFSRLFTARMGRSVMAHVRGRRLIRAARRLAEEPGLKLVDLALDCGFESQEAFTRAFKRVFGVAPGRFRLGFAPGSIDEGRPAMDTHATAAATSVIQLPDLVQLEGFSVAGPSRRFDQASKSDIPQLWPVLMGALPFEGQQPSWTTYGVVWSADRTEGSFHYMAGVRVAPHAKLPQGFTVQHIPPATYAVFRITLDGTALHPQIKGAMARIWGELLPASGLTVLDGRDFECYDGRFAPDRPGAEIDFYVPVQAG